MKLTTRQAKQKETIAGKLRVAWKKLADAYKKAKPSERTKPKAGPLKEAFQAATLALKEANAFADSVAQQIDDYVDNKSDAWQDSERGMLTEDMLAEWQGFVDDFDAVDLDAIEENPADALDDLPNHPD